MNRIVKIAIIAGILLLIAGLFFVKEIASHTDSSGNASWTDKMRLDYANVLLSKGLNAEAAQEFEAYVARSRADKKELAGICYKLGNIYLGLKDYEKALASFYKSELLDPEPEYRQDMNQKIVSSLENLGLSQQAQYELENRSSIKPSVRKDEKVAVRIGKREITNEEIDAAINRLPENIRKGLSSSDAKLKFVREYVATEVLYEKGKKLGLDKKPDIRYAVEDFKRQLVLRDLLSDEIRKELRVTPEDVALYYKANKDSYSVPERARVSFLEISAPAKEGDVSLALKEGKGKKIGQWVEKGRPFFLPGGIGMPVETADAILNLDKGGISAPVKVKDNKYMFIVDQKEQRREREFQEVKEQVERQYRAQKEQQIVQSFLDKAIEQQEIEIFYQPKTENEEIAK
ncbi:MAG: peptidyl-prolyl cis-trans isomerase [Candidatus Omnitrophica bacterium]|nr:peptidyl-prolyl cis-trans isomerase [Candidatus Omnitrophota bacterium]MDD5771350.1 peptidyl-prolyl cis-trans isomerase [Candidatus Omnitrophota bacterium]